MASLVTLAVAKTHLNVTTNDQDDDIALKAAQASYAIVRYLGTRADVTWTAATVPSDVQTAILLVLGNLREYRGDDAQAYDPISPSVRSLLAQRHVPALA